MRSPVYIDVPDRPQLKGPEKLFWLAKGALLSPIYWAAAAVHNPPGLSFRARCFALGLRLLAGGKRPLPAREVQRLLGAPMDSVRYFELDFAWHALEGVPLDSYLDVSSPRFFPIVMAHHRPSARVTLLNPDADDLAVTRTLIRSARLEERVRYNGSTIEEAPWPPAHFGAISCISVLEHIADDRRAVEGMWKLLRPGGTLVLTVPCAKETFEEHASRSFYGSPGQSPHGYTFWQRFYDSRLLEERILSRTGPPTRFAVYGERVPGTYRRHTQEKLSNPDYPVWRESYMMARKYSLFDRIDDLPGIGVIALELRRP